MEVLLLMVMGLTNIACFMIGVSVRQKVDNGEEVKLPTINPVEIQREKQAKHEAEMEKNRIDTILRNIDNYDGTSYRQEDVPGR
jgi:hypothetical protein